MPHIFSKPHKSVLNLLNLAKFYFNKSIVHILRISISNTNPQADDSSSQAWELISVTNIEKKSRAGWPPHSILKNSPTGLLRNVSSEQALNQLWEICTPAYLHIFPFWHFIPRFLSIFHLFLSYSQLFFTVFVFTKSVSYMMLFKVI